MGPDFTVALEMRYRGCRDMGARHPGPYEACWAALLHQPRCFAQLTRILVRSWSAGFGGDCAEWV
jgi:hypothetical protein